MTWFLMLSHQKITNTAIQIYFQNELWLNGAYCRNRLSEISINKCQCITLNEYVNIKTHRVACYVRNNATRANLAKVSYVDSWSCSIWD